jgi:putative FmdB family regulatory protein
MPTYEYRCDGCGATLDRWQRFHDSPLTQCPSCGGRLQRVFSPVGIVFKGSGWYKTDSRSTPNSETESSPSKLEPAGAIA